MKKIIISLLLLSVLALPVVATAVVGGGGSADIPAQPGSGTGPQDLNDLYNVIGRIAWQVFAIIALIMFTVAAILFLTAGGDPEKITVARTAFLWGVVGIVVAIVAFSIVMIVGTEFTP